MSRALDLANLKAALFDVDGTLVDSVATITAGLRDAFDHLFGERLDDERLRSLVGMPLRQQLSLYAPSQTTEAEYSRMIGYVIERYEAHGHLERPHHAAVQALAFSRRVGLKTALVTSKNAAEVARFKERFDFANQVDAIVGASDVDRPKPWPDSVIKACDLLGVKPSEAVMIGDSVYDVRSARAASVATIAVTYGFSTFETLSMEEPDLLLASPDALLTCFQNAFQLMPCQERN